MPSPAQRSRDESASLATDGKIFFSIFYFRRCSSFFERVTRFYSENNTLFMCIIKYIIYFIPKLTADPAWLGAHVRRD
jgi:hypothetical protein